MARTRREEVPEPGFQVVEKLVEGARAFVTIGPEHPTWGGERAADGEEQCTDLGLRGGEFVRVEPPGDASDEDVADVRRAAEKVALRVVVLRRRRAQVLTAPREKRPHRRARDVVHALVEDANVEDRPALAALCEGVMSKRGL